MTDRSELRGLLPSANSTLTEWAMPGRAATRSISVRQGSRAWETISYEGLGRRVRSAAACIAEVAGPDDVVVVLTGSSFEVITSSFGVLYAGSVPSILPPPRMFEQTPPYVERLSAMLHAIGATVALVSEPLASVGAQLSLRHPLKVIPIDQSLTSGEELTTPFYRAPDARAIVQFTSGSSGPQRGVVLTRAALEAQLVALRSWLVADPATDVSVSWLPAHHDMGFVGLTLLPVVNQAETRLLSPEEFVRRPLSWLETISDHHGTVSACPPFGLSHCVRALQRRDVPELDLRSLRRLVVGAERVMAGPLERFVELTERFGLDPDAILPAYGLAEAVLGVTGTTPGSRPTKVRLRPNSIIVGRPLEIEASGRLFDGVGEPDWLVSSGRVLPGVEVVVVGDDDMPVGDGVLGYVTVRGQSVAHGYLDFDGFVAPWPPHGPVQTGDAGFMLGTELFVLGRHGDGLKVRGRAVFAESVETRIDMLPGGPHRMVVVMGSLAGRDTLIVVYEGSVDHSWHLAALRVAKAELEGADVDTKICRVSRRTIEYTSSGKPRRRPLWAGIASGQIDLDCLALHADESNTRDEGD